MYIYKYLIDAVSAKWRKTNSAISNLKISKEEKKMHKKQRIHGHVVHKLVRSRCGDLYYTVEPEHSCIAVYILMYDPAIGEPYYSEFEDITISTAQLGRPGYLQEQIEWIARRHSDHPESEVTERIAASQIRDHFKYIMPNKDVETLANELFKEEKKMTEYYVIDVEMTDDDLKTKRTECLQIRQSGNYFEIPFDCPADISEYRLDRLEKCLHDYILETNKKFRVSVEKSNICSNAILKITTPYDDISDDANREELCKMLTYAVEHGEYPYPIGNADLTKICFYLRECENHEIYKKVYSKGIDCAITIEGKVFRDGLYFDYIPEPRDIIKLRFMDGRLTHYTLADDPKRELIASTGNTPGALYHIYKRDKPYQYVKELRASLHEIYSKRVMWRNASYVTFTQHGLTTTREKI